jgi:hypothetical protein
MTERSRSCARQAALIDDYMPSFDAVERHVVVVRAPPAEVYATLRTVDFSDSAVIRTLLALRALPGRLAGTRTGGAPPEARPRARPALTLDTVLRSGFVVLAEAPGRELLLGVAGRFWTPTGSRFATDGERFRGPMPPGTARAAWNFTVHADPRGTRLATETRVQCADRASRRRFRAYWLLVRPFSGLIRRRMLAAIRRAAEQRD